MLNHKYVHVSEVSNFRRDHIWFEVRYVTQVFAIVTNSYQCRLICGESNVKLYNTLYLHEKETLVVLYKFDLHKVCNNQI